MAKQTIKAAVISEVRRDPFLSIDEIAARVQTTPRYVRTILSEAQLSLLQLRKRYAKKMEKQLQLKADQMVVSEYDSQLKVVRVQNRETAGLLKQEADCELMQISRMQTLNNISAYCELITYLELSLDNLGGPLTELLSLAEVHKQQSWVEVTVNPNLAKMLTGNKDELLLKLKTLLVDDNNAAIAVETLWLPAEGVLLRSKVGSIEIATAVN